MAIPQNNFVKITVTLPVCLHLDGREFRIPYRNGKAITVNNENIFSTRPTHLGKGNGVEVDSDTFSYFRFSRVSITIPTCKEETTDPSQILTHYQETFFKSLNRFIDAARATLQRKGLRHYFDYSDFVDTVRAESSKNSLSAGISFPDGGVIIAKPVRSPAEHEQFQQILDTDISLSGRFILDAERELYYKNYPFALLNSVIALEIVVSDTIRGIANHKGISEKEINEFIQGVGLTGNIKSTLRLLAISNTILPNDINFSQCKSAITLRNRIMHRGQRDVPEGEIPSYLESIKMVISYCKQLEDQYSKTSVILKNSSLNA